MVRPKPPANWIGQTIGNRYKIDEQLGQGGMSAVYKATDPNLRRPVAVKLIHSHLSTDPQFVRRFEQEAAAIAQLRHPNIIQVYDFNHDEQLYYMVMEYVPGQDLKDRLQALSTLNRRFPLDDTIYIMSTICDAAAYAHKQNMIHRDLKPANVMITPEGRPVLMDFGVAKLLDGIDHTATGAIIGTAKYLSPEQARGERPDERSDIYSLGVMLYEMVAGKPPFEADTTMAVLMKHVNDPLPDIRSVQRDVPDAIVNIIEKALAKDRNARYQSAAHMATDLRAATQTASNESAAQKTVSSKKRAETDPTISQPLARLAEEEAQATAPQPAEAATGGNKTLITIGAVAVGLLLLGAGAVFAFSGLFSDEAVREESQPDGQAAAAAADTADLPSATGMRRIGGGSYTVGSDPADRDHAATQQVNLEEFWLDQHEVTNVDYARFLAETETEPPHEWSNGSFPADEENHPVKGVTWEQAAAYCSWAGKRLPTEAEWEVAARGAERRLFPWSDDLRAVTLPRSGTYPVGSKATNQSPFGVFDMAGNVWEWVAEPYAPVEEGNRLLRGGANGFLKDMAYRLQGDPEGATMIAAAGMRCAASQVNVVQATTQAEDVLYEDTFADPGSGWPILAQGAYVFGYHPPDFYHVELSQPENFTAVSRPPDFNNITVEAAVQVDNTDTETGDFRYGLTLRRSAENQFYAFTISSRSGQWFVLKSSADGLEVLAEGSVDSLQGFAPPGFTPQTSDLLRVDASGSTFVFHINGEVVTQIEDLAYSAGEVGFFVQNFDETRAHVHFDSLTIREPELAAVPIPGLLLLDEFVDPESGWQQEEPENAPYRVGYHPPDYYHVEVSAPNEYKTIARTEMFDDVTVEAQLFVDFTGTDAGDFRYGLMLRQMADDEFYAFTISSRSQKWAILKSSPDGFELLAEGPVESLQGFAPPGFTPETPDLLRIDAGGDAFIFSINGEQVTSIRDSDYSQGAIGFFVETFEEELAHIHYDRLVVRKVDEAAIAQLPLPEPTASTAEPAPTAEPTSVSTAEPTTSTAEPPPTSEPTSAPTAEPTSERAPGASATPATATKLSESMIFIPTGNFLMGSATGQPNEAPEHQVFLDPFFIDRYEVTNEPYRACIEAGECTLPSRSDSYTRSDYQDNPEFNNYPIVNVSWDQAAAYCQWAGKRLPTEAEWEYAASGPDNLTWPWGDEFEPDLSAASQPDTVAVDSYPDGVSHFGLYNMAGNVSEWVQDVYQEDFYSASSKRNPLGQGDGADRIFRGGSFGNTNDDLYTTSRRYIKDRSFNDVDIGFRCALSVD